jgi:hypothetical protein
MAAQLTHREKSVSTELFGWFTTPEYGPFRVVYKQGSHPVDANARPGVWFKAKSVDRGGAYFYIHQDEIPLVQIKPEQDWLPSWARNAK